MPRSTFKASALDGAMPGLTRLAASLMGKDQAYQQGYDSENLNQSRMAQALSQIQMHNAQADKLGAEAAQQKLETDILGKRPDQYEEQAALASGTDLPMVRAIRQSLKTGQTPQMEMAGPTEDGGPLMGDIDPGKASAVRQALQRLAPLVTNTGDFKIDDWAKAQGIYRDADLSQGVIDGKLNRNTVAGAQAAAAGKSQYNSDANGAVLDLFSGNLDTNNPMAGSTIALRGAQAGAQKANAAQSYAAAENSRASAAQTRAQMAEGTNRGGAKAPAGYRWAADGVSLETIPGGPADPNTKGAKLAKPPTEGQAKALMFGGRMAVADEIFKELESQGVNRPGAIKQAAQGVLGALPLIGDSLAAGAGAATNWTQSAAQQRVEQAQRDFINAVLRRESGAAISAPEFANAAQQYFPQPGDSPAVIRQKAANRQTAISGFKAEFGEQSMPQFNQMLEEARAARRTPGTKPVQQPQRSGGATGEWGDSSGSGGWSIERVN